jgi:hypothetical protein
MASGITHPSGEEQAMQLFNGLTIEQIIAAQDEIFLRVPVEIDPLGRENHCYSNCVAKVERDGGQVVVGWRKTCATVGAAIIATLDHHAIWQSPSGALIDISARVRFFNGEYQRLVDQYVDFMIDPAATFENTDHARRSRVIPIIHDKYDYLIKACEWAERAIASRDAGDESKAAYADKKVMELLNRHYEAEKRLGIILS